MATEKQIREITVEMALEMTGMQQQLHEAGLHETAHAVNAASKKLGWETERAIIKIKKEQESE